eukprot:maker-scaffold_8-snap-gene-9.21-mRNA-1 protein AED:0.06 eAED:0.06 QI:120/0.8/0.83/1/0.8/0.66/6/454/402
MHLETALNLNEVTNLTNSPSEPPLTERSKQCIMETAAASALVGVNQKHGGPFGAVVVRKGKFVSTAHNTVLIDQDPTCHAEMNAIRYACTALKSHDLSDCELFTTCEPCPMCWGAIQWARLKKVYIGVDRFTAASFGFDDKVFYDEIEAHNHKYSLQKLKLSKHEMVEVFSNASEEVILMIKSLMKDLSVNKTFRRRMGNKDLGFISDGKQFENPRLEVLSFNFNGVNLKNDEDEVIVKKMNKYFDVLQNAIRVAVNEGINKEREIFGSLIVKGEEVIAISVNEVLRRADATSTSEILCIRKAAKKLGSYNLSGCEMYTSIEPDVMSLGGVLWSRIDKLYYGLSQKEAAKYGFEEGLLQYRELFAQSANITDSGLFEVEKKVGFDKCEAVFKEWKEVNNVIY